MEQSQHPLQYKTRGNTSPQGKSRVYFCCHPDDMATYFESISDDILASQNCSVWYAQDANAARDEAFLNDLAQMQLFVMPVSSNLMYKPSQALHVEFPFAVQHHIPILPLMQESGLEDVFNQKCGNLQFLDANARDVTAIPYQDKLKTFLSSVLIGDETAQKIRAAFDAYIFLSYRKKDRKYAQELMHLIHKNEFCRDIAIWYDEFLTPGENFNDAIKHALDKSDLFVMTVTPNLVCEPNYIMDIEYPMARDVGKLIIPAEMVQTDRDALCQNFKQLPTPTDARDSKALRQSLLSTVQALAIKENDDSPEHNFFIGLAYLGGIDVEIDHERALALITASAEAGLPEAINKLIQMYENGEGVARNYEAAIVWREKKILHAEKTYSDSHDEPSLHELFWAITACGSAYRSLGKESLAHEKHLYALSLLESSGMSEASPRILRDLAVCYRNLGVHCSNASDFDNAKIYHNKVLAITEQLFEASPSASTREDLIIAYITVGIPGYSGANAVSYREKAIAIAEELVRETGSIRARELLVYAYKYHGIFLKISGKKNLPLAKGYYEKMLPLAKELFIETGTLQAQRDLGDAYSLIASICESEGDTEAKLQWEEKCLEISEELAKKTHAVQDRSTLSSAYARFAMYYEQLGIRETALLYHQKEHAIRKEIAAISDSVPHLESFARSNHGLGEYYRTAGDIDKAFEYYDQELSVQEQVARNTQSWMKYETLANTCHRIAGYHPKRKATYLQRALDIYRKLYEEHPEKNKFARLIEQIEAMLAD